jgi:apolipoprotein N-acyltransferase
VALLAALALAAPPDFSRPAAALTVTLLQTNVAQDQKFAIDRMPEALAWVAQALTGARGELVVAPETAVPLMPWQLEELVPGYWPALQAHFAVPGRAALVGVPLGDYDSGYTNSVVALSAAAPYRYDKWHLVPFGEFIPRGFRWFTDLMHIPLGDFARGLRRPPSFVHLGARASRPTSATRTCSARSWPCASPTRRARRRCSPTSATSAGSATPSRWPST